MYLYVTFCFQDSQEFLRCFMDQLHEELKQPSVASPVSEASDDDVSDSDASPSHDRVTSGSTVDECSAVETKPLIGNSSDRAASKRCEPQLPWARV